jgi:putative transposase
MRKSRARVRRSAEQWRKIFDELQASGLDRKTFCERRGLGRETLRRAERRLERAASVRSRFVEVTPVPVVVEPSRGWDVELELGDGVVLRLARR